MQLPPRRRIADRIWQWRKTAYAVSVLVVLAALVLIFLSISTPSTAIEIPTDLTFFNSKWVFGKAQELARLYPDRPLASPESQGAVSWYEEQLTTLGIDFEHLEYTVPYGTEKVLLRNVAVVLPGSSTDTVVISSPRDTVEDPELSPLAQSAGTASLMDLIRVFADRDHEKTLIFLSTEGGSQANLGMAAFLDAYPQRSNIEALISIRALGMEGRDELLAGTAGPGNATPGWLVQLATEVLKQIDVDLRVPNLQQQVADQALQLFGGEQVAGLRRGIASLSIYDRGEGTVTAAGLSTQGTAVERLLLALDQAGALPADPGTAIVLGAGRFITRRTLDILGVIVLLPSLFMAIAWLLVNRLNPSGWLRHMRNLASFLLPVGLVPVLAWIASRLGLLPRYLDQVVPSTSLALQPNWLLTLLFLLLGGVLFIVSRHFLGYLRPQEPKAVTEMAKLTGGLVLLEIGLILLLSNSPFSLLAGLTAAWIWPLCTCFLEPPSAAVPWWPQMRTNVHIVLAGLIAPLILYVSLATSTAAGWMGGWWFLIVQTVSGAYGIAAPAGAVFIFSSFIVLLGSRRLQLIPVESLRDTRDDISLVMAPPPRVLKVRKKTRPSS